MLYCALCEKGRLELKSLTTHLTHPRKTLSRLTFLIIKMNEYDVAANDLADPLYRLPSECVTVLINNLEQMRMLLQR